MSGWHEASCPGANVYLSDQNDFPRCRNCKGSAEETIRWLSQRAQMPLASVPPDEPAGKMNLSWPPSVPYTRLQASAAVENEITEEELKDAPELPLHRNALNERSRHLATAEKTDSTPRYSSSIYQETITNDKFRLIYMHGAQDAEEPLHLMLEVYEQGNCPEYETVSYTWGGEDDDCTLCRPVYLGDSWDILLQTENCWQMLCWLRPRRGSRTIWVDAICINQEDLHERGHQVARMKEIYSECSQVVLWLGPDVVSHKMASHPRRYRFSKVQEVFQSLQENVSKTGKAGGDLIKVFDIKEVLKRRYFGRVWVIQELVLAPRVVIPIHDYVFWADGSPLSLPKDVEWENTRAPWLSRVALQDLEIQDTFELLGLASQSQATDRRDRVFGVLALEAARQGETPLQADYNLSFQHVFVGIFGHCLINHRRVEVLSRAAGISDGRSNLTWVPPWRSHESWAEIFQGSKKISLNGIVPAIRKALEAHNPGKLRWISQCGTASELTTEVFKTRPWHKDCSIDADTGALSLYLTSLFVLKSRVRYLCSYEGTQIYQLQAGQAKQPVNVYLATSSPLETLVEPGDKLFVLDPGVGELSYLILRPVRQLGAFRLVAVCSCVIFQDQHHNDHHRGDDDATIMLDDIQAGLFRDISMLRTYFASPHSSFQRKLGLWRNMDLSRRTGQKVHPENLYPWSGPWEAHIIMFLSSILEGLSGVETATRTSSPGQRRYLETIPDHFQPRLLDGYIMITLGAEDWKLLWGSRYYYEKVYGWEWSKEGSETWQRLGGESRRRNKGPFRRTPKKCTLRLAWQEIESSIEAELKRLHMGILYRQGVLGDTEEQVCKRIREGPTTEHYYTGSILRGHGYQGHGVVRDARIQGSTAQVRIV